MEERSYFRAGFKPHEWGLDTVTRPQASQLGLWDDRSAPKGANSKKVEAERLGGRARPSVSPQGLLHIPRAGKEQPASLQTASCTLTETPAGKAGEGKGWWEKAADRDSKGQRKTFPLYDGAVLEMSALPSLPLARPLKNAPPYLLFYMLSSSG